MSLYCDSTGGYHLYSQSGEHSFKRPTWRAVVIAWCYEDTYFLRTIHPDAFWNYSLHGNTYWLNNQNISRQSRLWNGVNLLKWRIHYYQSFGLWQKGNIPLVFQSVKQSSPDLNQNKAIITFLPHHYPWHQKVMMSWVTMKHWWDNDIPVFFHYSS